MVNEVIGDLFKGHYQLLIHGCNCFCTMRSGVAKTVVELYPGAQKVDLKSAKGDKSKLGSFSFWIGEHAYHGSELMVVNLYSQYRYGSDQINVDYDALRTGLKLIKDNILPHAHETIEIGIPKIGAGLAGGEWKIIREIIDNIFMNEDKINVTVYKLE